MNAFNPITTMQRLEGVGMDRKQAETLADELHHATTDLVTKDELTKALDAHANKVTIRITGAMAAMFALALTFSKLFAYPSGNQPFIPQLRKAPSAPRLYLSHNVLKSIIPQALKLLTPFQAISPNLTDYQQIFGRIFGR